MNKKTFYLTTTLPYVNAPLHLGHALELIRADAIARYKKQAGFDVFFNTGTDEHGAKIYEKAQEEGITPLEFTNKGFLAFKSSTKMLGVSEDVHFIRTTDEKHIKSAQAFWKRCDRAGYIYKKNYSIKYCIGCEEEKSDSELEKGRCPIHLDRELELIEEENYFFRYSEFGEKLLDFYDKNPNFIIPDFRFNEIKQFVKKGLQDFSISRLKAKMPWGIEVPGDPEQVMYVWFDALTNYVSTLDWENNTKNTQISLFEKYWINGNPTQYCGKDNTRFQGAMWQAMLMAGGLPNSKQIVVNGFITGEGGIKMSKSIGNVVDPKEIVAEYGTDALRYFLLREISPFEDSPFSIERFKEVYNAGLANGLGNLVSRIMKMAISYDVKYKLFSERDMQEKFEKYYGKEIETFNIKNILDDIWGSKKRTENQNNEEDNVKDIKNNQSNKQDKNIDSKLGILDRKINEEKPFSLFRTEPEKAKTIVADLILYLDEIAFFLKPFMPETSEKIRTIIRERKTVEIPLFPRKD